VLLGPEDRIWLIDHGLCFHQEYKLRTVIWDFAGEPIPDPLLKKTSTLLDMLNKGALADPLYGLLSQGEMAALAERARQLLQEATFPTPGERRHYPWPLV
ncbi:MAG: phosphatidylinositol kinase, partial [Anaerolineales bacterium]